MAVILPEPPCLLEKGFVSWRLTKVGYVVLTLWRTPE